MNFVRHINSAFGQFYSDTRLLPGHISLYMALFFYWNLDRFPETLSIDRKELMQMAKIGSRTTYYRLIRNLSDWDYIEYLPSKNSLTNSKGNTTFRMFKFCSSTCPDMVRTRPEIEQERPIYGHPSLYNKHIKQNKLSGESLPKNEFEVIEYFFQKKWPDTEAMKFFNHYEGVGWKVGGKIQITNWRAIADNWLLKAKEIKKEKISKINPLKRDHLMTVNQKDYGKPL